MPILGWIRDILGIRKDLIDTKKSQLEVEKLEDEARAGLITPATLDDVGRYDPKITAVMSAAGAAARAGLARRLGLFDVTMLVMGGIIGAGIFRNSNLVAQQVHTPFLILGAWLLGGAVALAGAFVYAELAARRPEVGGQYAYLREAFHPSVAFLYGWALLLIIQTGAMAGVALIFAGYFNEIITGVPGTSGHGVFDQTVAAVTLLLLTVVNCLGVRAGGRVQSVLMVLKIVALAVLVVYGLFFVGNAHALSGPLLDAPASANLLARFGAAMTFVMFAYGGWQTASFVAGEMREPRRNLPRALLLGVAGVILLYVLANVAYLRALGAGGLKDAVTPAADAMKGAFYGSGARFISVGIAISTLGFLSQGMLTAPRVYFAMAQDGLFFKSVARVSARTHAPVVAIALQGVLAAAIALTMPYGKIIDSVVLADFTAFGLTALSLFVFRRSQPSGEGGADGEAGGGGFRVPGHPLTTAFFAAACALIVASIFYNSPRDSAYVLAIVASGLPAYLLWRGRKG